jgi:hypothetical protein
VDLQLTANLVLWAFSVLLESFVVAQPNVLDGNASGIAGFRGDPQQGEICVVGGFDLLDGQTWVFRVKAHRWRPVGAEFNWRADVAAWTPAAWSAGPVHWLVCLISPAKHFNEAVQPMVLTNQCCSLLVTSLYISSWFPFFNHLFQASRPDLPAHQGCKQFKGRDFVYWKTPLQQHMAI